MNRHPPTDATPLGMVTLVILAQFLNVLLLIVVTELGIVRFVTLEPLK